MNNKDSLKKVIDLINTGKKYPALSLVKTNPELAALMSKLIKPRDQSEFKIDSADSYHNLNQGQMQAISENIKNRVADNESISQLFPDVELAMQILISSVLSPKDMVKTDIIYKAKDNILPAELMLKLNEIVVNNFEGYYHIKDDLQEILRETLFTSGSYIKAVLPESIIDEIINKNKAVSTETISELYVGDKTTHLGLLGSPKKPAKARTALESFRLNQKIVDYQSFLTIAAETEGGADFTDSNLEISDNYKLLKLPRLLEAVNKAKIKAITRNSSLGTATESAKLNRREFSTMIYKGNSSDTSAFVTIPSRINAKRKSVGRPLTLKLPSEAVIPVYVPSNETKHIGYFVLVDIDGNPINKSSNQNDTGGLSGLNMNNPTSGSLSSMLIAKAKRNLVSTDNNKITLDQIMKIYSNIVETDLVERLKNGAYGTEVSIGKNEEIYRIMFARSLASKYTRLIYIPAEFVTYYAFKYYDNGIGKSMLDDLKILTSLRAIMLFSKVMAQTKNSIALTHVDITLDPNDPDPQKTIEIAQHEIVKTRQQYFPLGINSPVDLVDWIQRAGFEFSFSGHPGLPQTKFDFETKNLQHILPDSELDELLRKQTYMAMGLSPETVDNGFNAEFATTVVSNNILLSKRVIQLQYILVKHLTDHCRKLMLNDNVVIDEIKQVLKDNKGLIEKVLTDEEKASYSENEEGFINDLIERYIENIELDLPKPDETSINTQSDAFDAYVEALDKVIDSWVSADLFPTDTVGDISSHVDSIKVTLRAYFIRKWMAENNYLGELGEIVTADEDGNPNIDIFNISKTHAEGIIRSSVKYIESLNAIKNAANSDLESLGTPEGTDTTSEEPSDTDNSSDTNMDDFGLDTPTDDAGGNETPPEDNVGNEPDEETTAPITPDDNA